MTEDERLSLLEANMRQVMERLGMASPPAPVAAPQHYKVRDGWLTASPSARPVDMRNTPSWGGKSMTRRGIVIHYTAGRGFNATTRWFEKDTSRVSAHVLVSKVATDPIRQFVDFGERAWHAGKSEFAGMPGCNGWAVGIELDNAGPLAAGMDRWGEQRLTWRGGPWEAFPREQIETTAEVILALVAEYPTIEYVFGHQDCALPAGRKRDPGPAFPWATLENLVGNDKLRFGGAS